MRQPAIGKPQRLGSLVPLFLIGASSAACSSLFGEESPAAATVDAASIEAVDATQIENVNLQIRSNLDIAVEGIDRTIELNPPSIDLGAYGQTTNIYIGLRYDKVEIPLGSTILSAALQFTAADGGESMPTMLGIRAQEAGNAPAFALQNSDISLRNTLGDNESWQVPTWIEAGDRLEAQRSPSLQNIVQEVVDQDDWQQENALVLIIAGVPGRRTANGFSGGSPTLEVSYIPSK